MFELSFRVHSYRFGDTVTPYLHIVTFYGKLCMSKEIAVVEILRLKIPEIEVIFFRIRYGSLEPSKTASVY